VIDPVTVPPALLAVITTDHEPALKLANVAVPVPWDDGVLVTPPIVNVFVTVTILVPPDHVTVKPVAVTLDEATFVIAVGAGNVTVVLPVTVVNPAAVITTAHDVPVNPVNVAVPTPTGDGVVLTPPIVKDVVDPIPTPPDQVTVNEVADNTVD